MLKKICLLFLCLALLVLTTVYVQQLDARSHPTRSSGKTVPIYLTRGLFNVFDFSPAKDRPRAIILFGSGDGGWSPWEDSVCRALSAGGYRVIGIDSAAYAGTDYDLTTLQSDFCRIEEMATLPYGKFPPPVILGGWSMGAAQAVAVAGGPHHPQYVAGLLLASLLSRGRYGLRIADQLNVLPTGPGTFAVDDFTHSLDHLRVVQWHAGGDSVDSRAWLQNLAAEHREYDVPNANHYFNNAPDAFLLEFVDSVRWIVGPSALGVNEATP